MAEVGQLVEESFLERGVRAAESTEEEWRHVMDVNITNMFHLCLRNEIPTMLDAGGGGIVYTASARV